MAAATTTLSITVAPRTTHLVWRPASFREYRTAGNTLIGIIRKYRDWHDDLSTKLQAWGTSTIATANQGGDTALERVSEKAAEVFQLLRDPMNNAPLVDPVLAGGGVWERWILQEYVATMAFYGLSLASPFNPKLSLDTEEVKEHTFAKEIASLAQGMLAESSTALIAPTGRVPYWDRETFSRSRPDIKVFIFQGARDTIAAARDKNDTLARMDDLEAVVAGKVSEELKATLTRLDEALETFRGDREATRRSYQEAKEALQSQQSLLQEGLTAAQKENETNRNLIGQLNFQVQSLRWQINELQDELDDSSCTIT